MTAKLVFVTYANGRIQSVKAVAENTAAAALNVNAIGAKSIRKMLSAGESALPRPSCRQAAGLRPLLAHGMLKRQITTSNVSLWLRISEGRFLKHEHMTTKRRCVSALDLEPLVRKRFDEFAIRSRRNAGNNA